jgi:hypothetical protein
VAYVGHEARAMGRDHEVALGDRLLLLLALERGLLRRARTPSVGRLALPLAGRSGYSSSSYGLHHLSIPL